MHTEHYKTLLKVIKEIQTSEKTARIHRSKDLILSRRQQSPSGSTGSKQSLPKSLLVWFSAKVGNPKIHKEMEAMQDVKQTKTPTWKQQSWRALASDLLWSRSKQETYTSLRDPRIQIWTYRERTVLNKCAGQLNMYIGKNKCGRLPHALIKN